MRTLVAVTAEETDAELLCYSMLTTECNAPLNAVVGKRSGSQRLEMKVELMLNTSVGCCRR